MKDTKEITIDGVVYVPRDAGGPIKIVVIERGFVYVGRFTDGDGSDGQTVTLRSARSLIRWGSSQHLGELVNGPLEKTKLGAPCTVRVREPQIIHVIEVSQEAWEKHIQGLEK